MKSIKRNLMIVVGIVVFAGIGLGVYVYRGIFLGEEYSPNKAYSLRYYSSFNIFHMEWSMPGDSACKPRWVRLYDKNGTKLNELYSSDCALENQVHWLDTEIILPDGVTVWRLPGRAR